MRIFTTNFERNRRNTIINERKIEESKRLDSGKYYPFRNGTKGFEHLEEDIEYLDELG